VFVQVVRGRDRFAGPAVGPGGNQSGLGVRRADSQVLVQNPAGVLEPQVGEQSLGGAKLIPRPPVQAE
jgi:hypothetical protein